MLEITEKITEIASDKWQDLTDLSKNITENMNDDFLEILALSAALD